MSDYYNHLARDDAHPVPAPEPDDCCDKDSLCERCQDKLAGYDLLALDARFATRRICLLLQRGTLPASEAEELRAIIDELLMRHLLERDRRFMVEMAQNLEVL